MTKESHLKIIATSAIKAAKKAETCLDDARIELIVHLETHSLRDLARKAGISAAFLSDICRGNRRLTLATAEKILRAL